MLNTYRNEMVKIKDTTPIHNVKYFSREQLKDIFFYEWMMNPFVYTNELQKRVYTINTRECLFTQKHYVYNVKDALKEFII